MHDRGLPLNPEPLLNLPFASPRARTAAAGSPPPRPAPVAPDDYAAVEVEVARTADLVLKVHRLLEQAEGLEQAPERAARIARLAWVVEHGRVALRRAAAEPAGDAVPQPRLRT